MKRISLYIMAAISSCLLEGSQVAMKPFKKATGIEISMINAANGGNLNEKLLGSYLNKGADIDAQQEDGATALISAAYLNKKNVVITLLNAGANPNIKTQDAQAIKKFLEAEPFSKDYIDKFVKEHANKTFFTVNPKLLEDPDVQKAIVDNQQRRAAYSNITPLVSKYGEKVTKKYFPRELTKEIMSFHKPITPAEHRKNELIDSWALSIPILQHVSDGTLTEEILKKHIAAGANINQRDRNGQTALHKALFSNLADIELLIAYGIDLDAQDETGSTALMKEALRENPNKTTIITLLKAGANPFIKTYDEKAIENTEQGMMMKIFKEPLAQYANKNFFDSNPLLLQDPEIQEALANNKKIGSKI